MQSKILQLELKELNYNALPIKLRSTVETLSYAIHHSYIKVYKVLRPFPHNPLVLQVMETTGTTRTSLGIKLTDYLAAEY